MAGDTLELKIIHPDVGSRSFNVKAGEDITQDLGGYVAEIMVNGNLTGHKSLSAKPWELAGISVECDPGDGSLEFLQDVQNSGNFAIMEWSHINGHVYKGTGTITGDLKAGTKEGYAPIALQGVGKLEMIA
jgi:hypothetical protein